ncbi:M23 family metallopeptidase [Streptomyces fildesensis]|uniref:M23 family metallopeptidase n=1 Tax=Streptomyces fildesensis TaxID=375757 RepID=A0ABW8CG76_9ACTN
MLIAGAVGPSVLPSTFTSGVALGLWAPGWAVLVVSLVLTSLPTVAQMAPRALNFPGIGNWAALNSPGTRVPSHRTNGYGQMFAVDLVHEPDSRSRPVFGEGPGFRSPKDFPAFGRILLAPIEGHVVAVRDGARDHRSRSTRCAVAYMILETMVRALGGARQVFGNHVILDLGDGTYLLLAHLRRGSIAVHPGQSVHRGQLIGQCGNSGNSSEPHLHLQLMDHRRPLLAAGLPFVFAKVSVDGREQEDHVPANGEVMEAGL